MKKAFLLVLVIFSFSVFADNYSECTTRIKNFYVGDGNNTLYIYCKDKAPSIVRVYATDTLQLKNTIAILMFALANDCYVTLRIWEVGVSDVAFTHSHTFRGITLQSLDYHP